MTITTHQPEAPPAPSDHRPRRPLRRVLRGAALGLIIGFVPMAALLLRPLYSSNLGIVDPGRVIRAAQPTSGLPGLIDDHHLASILNLRGGSSRDAWYAAEVRTAADRGVDFYDFPLSPTRRPGRLELLVLIDVLDHCRYPLLIHCKAGADRTGLASALYLMLHRDEPPEQAARSFTIYHSHVPIFGPQHLHEPLNEYAGWLKARALEHTPQRFRDWVRNEYRSDDPRTDPVPLVPGPRKAIRPQGLDRRDLLTSEKHPSVTCRPWPRFAAAS